MRIFTVLFILSALGLDAQCDIDRHNTSEDSGWVSCSTAPNPNPARANSHWVLYDFSFDYRMEQFQIWNHNHPESIDNGVQDVILDVSNDGVNWTEVAMITIPQGTGSPRYEGYNGPIIDATARYLLITVVSNYGGSCFAFAEVKIDVADDVECRNYDLLVGDLGNRKYTATEYINSEGLIAANKNVHFDVGTEAVLLGGFEAQTNTNFEISVLPCVDE